MTDVAVIGGGVMGVSVAYWLTRLRPATAVTVVEMDPTHARASTALSVASIRQQFSNPVNIEMSRFGIGFLRRFADEVGQPGMTLGLRENGYLFLAGTDVGAAAMRVNAALQRAHGAGTELLAPGEIAARFPWLDLAGVVLGAFGPRDEGWFDNMGLLGGLRQAARAQGAAFVRGRATGLLRAGDRVTGVTLADGSRLAAGAVVNAAGPRAAEVLRMLGEDYPVEPRKRTVFVVDAPGARHPGAPLLVDHTGFYMRPEGHAWIAAAVPEADGPADPDDFEPDLRAFEDVVWPRLYARVPGFDAAKVLRAWAGHYEYNRLDQNAIIGAHPRVPGLWLINGFSGHGLQQAPAAGRGLAEVILSGRYQTLDLTPLGMERVLAGVPFLERAVV